MNTPSYFYSEGLFFAIDNQLLINNWKKSIKNSCFVFKNVYFYITIKTQTK